jgi:hypothetical protein
MPLLSSPATTRSLFLPSTNPGNYQQITETAKVTLNQIRDWPLGRYQVESGSINWKASGLDGGGCTWTATGSRAANEDDMLMTLDLSKPYKAHFFAQDSITVHVTSTCTEPCDSWLAHPFALLSRETAGVPVGAKLKKISGSSPGSASDGA